MTGANESPCRISLEIVVSTIVRKMKATTMYTIVAATAAMQPTQRERVSTMPRGYLRTRNSAVEAVTIARVCHTTRDPASRSEGSLGRGGDCGGPDGGTAALCLVGAERLVCAARASHDRPEGAGP